MVSVSSWPAAKYGRPMPGWAISGTPSFISRQPAAPVSVGTLQPPQVKWAKVARGGSRYRRMGRRRGPDHQGYAQGHWSVAVRIPASADRAEPGRGRPR
jgi:hypothetical protein